MTKPSQSTDKESLIVPVVADCPEQTYARKLLQLKTAGKNW
jgi:hypothetical protein